MGEGPHNDGSADELRDSYRDPRQGSGRQSAIAAALNQSPLRQTTRDERVPTATSPLEPATLFYAFYIDRYLREWSS